MSDQLPNLHRSFFALLIGNLIAILGAGVISTAVCQNLFPNFFEQLGERIQQRREREAKQADPPADAPGKDRAAMDSDRGEKKDRGENNDRDESGGKENNDVEINDGENNDGESSNEKPEQASRQSDEDAQLPQPANGDSDDPSVELPPLEFPLGFLVAVLLVDIGCSLVAGWACIRIAGFAPNNHALLLALFLFVWKVQQLLGTATNQLPASLLTLEMVLVPIACVVGATYAAGPSAAIDNESDESLPSETDP